MRVCIDTNVLVQCFGRSEVGRPIRDALLAGQIELAVSNEVLLEDEEVITSDHHFDTLVGSGYKTRPITPQEFIRGRL